MLTNNEYKNKDEWRSSGNLKKQLGFEDARIELSREIRTIHQIKSRHHEQEDKFGTVGSRRALVTDRLTGIKRDAGSSIVSSLFFISE